MNTTENDTPKPKELAEVVRQACITVAREGFYDASMSGLCADGAIEAAISAIQMIDLEKLLNEQSDNIKGSKRNPNP